MLVSRTLFMKKTLFVLSVAALAGSVASAAEISGKIKLTGTPPPEKPITPDAMCGKLANGALAEADVRALRELTERLKRGAADPLSKEYPQMVSLLSQLELAALQAQNNTAKDNPARASGAVDDSRRYRDNVAEYYRRLGATND